MQFSHNCIYQQLTLQHFCKAIGFKWFQPNDYQVNCTDSAQYDDNRSLCLLIAEAGLAALVTGTGRGTAAGVGACTAGAATGTDATLTGADATGAGADTSGTETLAGATAAVADVNGLAIALAGGEMMEDGGAMVEGGCAMVEDGGAMEEDDAAGLAPVTDVGEPAFRLAGRVFGSSEPLSFWRIK